MFAEALNSNQELVEEFFKKVFQTKKFARSYLFLGASKNDKKNFCYELAKILNCEKNKNIWLDKIGNAAQQNALFAIPEKDYKEACATCQNCLWIMQKTHSKTPFFVESNASKSDSEDISTKDEDSTEDKVSKKKRSKNIISVATARKVSHDLLQSSEYFRVIVFEDASKNVLSNDSAAVLLKTVEEAKPNTMFVFFADTKDNVLSTIVSRCQLVNFRASGFQEEISEELTDLKVKIRNFINSAALKDELERVIFSEELASSDYDLLLNAVSSSEGDLSEFIFDLNQANAIFIYEQLLFDLKSFVKVKAALKDFFDNLANLELSSDYA